MIQTIRNYYDGIKDTELYVNSKIETLKRHPDIMEEFVYWIENGSYKSNGVEVEGYTAEKLAQQSRYLVGEGSFLLLIELRERPDKARRMIAGGFKMK